MAEDFRSRAVLRPHGRHFEDFTPGMVFHHHWGRTINESDNSLFTTLTLHFNPLYFNVEHARAAGHPGIVVNPMLVFDVVFGLSVQDLSESGGFFLGVDALAFHEAVYPGDTLTGRSTCMERRESATHSGMGIATWHTEGFAQHGRRVIDFRRTNMVMMRPPVAA